MHRPVRVRVRARLLAPHRRREHDVGELRRLRQEGVADHEEQALLGQDRADPVQLRQRDRRVRGRGPEEADRALLGEAEDLHRVRRRRPVRDRQRVDVPERGQFVDVRVVLEVAEGRQSAVRTGLARVLRGRLAVHLEDRAAGLADHAAQQVDVVQLHRCRSGLVRLVHALQARRNESFAAADDACGRTDRIGRHAADLRRAFRRVLKRSLLGAPRNRRCAPRRSRGRSSRSRAARAGSRSAARRSCRCESAARRRPRAPRASGAGRRRRASAGRDRAACRASASRARSASRPRCGRPGRACRTRRCRCTSRDRRRSRSSRSTPTPPSRCRAACSRRGGASRGRRARLWPARRYSSEKS
jgi:hypothetical protein